MKNLIIKKNNKIKDALIKLEKNKEKCLIVVNDLNKFIGTLNDGDIRRALMTGVNTDTIIEKYLQKKSLFLYLNKFKKIKRKEILKLLEKKRKEKIDIIPILNSKKKVVKVVSFNSFIKKASTKGSTKESVSNIPLVVMAGGKGTRLKPFTNFFPKALMPFSNSTASDFIINHFSKFGINNFIFSINSNKELIKSYFRKKNIKFVEEKKPLGTIGSLSLIKENSFKDIMAINCDSMVTLNVKKFLDEHYRKKNDLTIAVTTKELKLSYGSCALDPKTGKFKSIVDKPSTNHLVNIGLYLFKKNIISLIPKNTKFDVTDLINKAKKKNKKIGIFPISEDNWIDTGSANILQK